MTSIRKYIVRYCLLSTVILLSSVFSLGTVAADSTDSDCQPPAASQPGVDVPTGAAAVTYTYQCSGQYAGDWTNPYYVYYPSTDTYAPLFNPDYTYNCTSGTWSMEEWDYSPANGQFSEQQVATSAPSGMSTDCPVTPSSSAADSSTDPGSGSTSADLSGSDASSTSPSGISNSGPDSTNTTGTTDNNNVNDDNDTNLSVSQNIGGDADTGDAVVIGNTTAGDATSGAAQEEANIVNMLQSTSNALGSGTNVVTFTDNINGDVNGNLLLDPSTLASVQNTGPNSINDSDANLNNNLTINNSNGAAINNNINLAADSGNATVSDNTSGGNATSGDADSIANVVNSIDSAISAGDSFIGTININGDLNGNILIPSDFVNELLADNVPTVTLTGPSSLNSADTTVNNNTTVTNTNNQGINNSVTADASSGDATVSDNTSAGGATSGNATTSITAFNLTGTQVIGANDLLVFVNVAGGNWVGLILNAPAGSTAAELGGGITSSGPNSTNSTDSTINNNASLNNITNDQINNNIDTTAKSGNATVSYNTSGGNATSGNADNAVNLLNVENSSLSLSGWFGILFINVFGTWNGNLGTYSPTTAVATGGYSSTNPINSSTASGSSTVPSLLRFIPSSYSAADPAGTGDTGSSGSGPNSLASYVLVSGKLKSDKDTAAKVPQLANTNKSYTIPIICLSAFGVYLVAEVIRIRRKHALPRK